MKLTVMSINVKHGAVKTSDGRAEDRWPGIVDIIQGVNPDILLLQEASFWTENLCRQWARAERDLRMRIHIGPSSTGAHTAIGHRPEIPWSTHEERYARHTMHGFTHISFDLGLEWPLVVIAAHLSPYSAQVAAQEMQLIAARAYRYGGVAVIGGDMNHPPLGDPDPDWQAVRPYNRSARTVPTDPGEPLRGNTIVGQIAHRADLTDIAAHKADTLDDQSLRAPTGHHGLIRVDWMLTTPAVLPAVEDYQRIDTRPHTDHDATAITLDTNRIDVTQAREAV